MNYPLLLPPSSFVRHVFRKCAQIQDGGKQGARRNIDITNESEIDEDNDEEVTAAEVLKRLEQAWLNEKLAPELLESKIELVECLLEQIKEMEENLKNAVKGDLVGSLHKLEIQRIRYIISNYLKIRIKKIEKYAFHIMDRSHEKVDYISRLSSEEHFYAKEYCKNLQDLLKSLTLDCMPSNINTLDKRNSVPHPNLESYLFIKVLKSQEQVELDPEDQPSDLEEGAQHLVRYSAISSLLENGAVALI
ncbi:DNA replication complex GINS protein SLD5-like [Xenia sp. Carnegie-2017]|uniref:DNA replication complex GINS protein SLD5-like n=1 Tax=Xenia sp. Carnegie-2017 TaxID=2897299 RepID=UPI001F04425C|nr:DNA replication complex GINS protein SLD5-like [Xenia sp. Carnegie-2017]